METAATDQTLDWLTLSFVSGAGPATLWPLVHDLGSPAALLAATEADININVNRRESFLTSRKTAPAKADAELARCREEGISIVTPDHPHYPPLLAEIHDPPFVLFVCGNTGALAVRKTLAVVGTRRATDYGRKATRKLVADLKGSGICIVSGLAEGIDGEAHQAALDTDLPTVAVFGCGLDTIYPDLHKPLARRILEAGGALVSEFPWGTRPDRGTFPRRNRIVAGMSGGTLVVEGGVKSGAMITARLASEEGRTVFALPGNIFSAVSQGPLSLIKNGATPVSEGTDIVAELNWQAVLEKVYQPSLLTPPSDEPDTEDLSDSERRLLENISYDPMPVDILAERLSLSTATLNQMLTMLELDGRVKTLPGAKICRI